MGRVVIKGFLQRQQSALQNPLLVSVHQFEEHTELRIRALFVAV
jgi:hypothetical protein